jgi:hypothetical protein
MLWPPAGTSCRPQNAPGRPRELAERVEALPRRPRRGSRAGEPVPAASTRAGTRDAWWRGAIRRRLGARRRGERRRHQPLHAHGALRPTAIMRRRPPEAARGAPGPSGKHGVELQIACLTRSAGAPYARMRSAWAALHQEEIDPRSTGEGSGAPFCSAEQRVESGRSRRCACRRCASWMQLATVCLDETSVTGSGRRGPGALGREVEGRRRARDAANSSSPPLPVIVVVDGDAVPSAARGTRGRAARTSPTDTAWIHGRSPFRHTGRRPMLPGRSAGISRGRPSHRNHGRRGRTWRSGGGYRGCALVAWPERPCKSPQESPDLT